jgi:hypothetical protein
MACQRQDLGLLAHLLLLLPPPQVPMDGKAAHSMYRAEAHVPSAKHGCLTLLSLWPLTGRTHQLRKHAAYIGHPILGDLRYKHHRKALSRLEAPGAGDFERTVWVLADEGGGAEGASGSAGAGARSSSSSGPDLGLVSPRVVEASVEEPSGEGWQGGAGPDDVMAAMAPEGEWGEAGAERRSELLSDGSPVRHICLWAVELQLRHPVTREGLQLRLGMPPALAAVVDAEAALGAGGQL